MQKHWYVQSSQNQQLQHIIRSVPTLTGWLTDIDTQVLCQDSSVSPVPQQSRLQVMPLVGKLLLTLRFSQWLRAANSPAFGVRLTQLPHPSVSPARVTHLPHLSHNCPIYTAKHTVSSFPADFSFTILFLFAVRPSMLWVASPFLLFQFTIW